MNSPIIFLIIWAIFNVLIKSSRDKKKAQNSKRTPTEEIDVQRNSDMAKRNVKTQKKNFRQTIEDYKEQIEKEFQMETKQTQEKEKPRKVELPKKKQAIIKADRETFREGRFWEEEEPEELMTVIEQTEISNAIYSDIRKDIVKAVVYSEILSKPKSLQ